MTEGEARFRRAFPGIALTIFLSAVDQTIAATALPAIAADMGGIERTSWILVAYLVAATCAAPVFGQLGDAFGRKPLLYVALSIFTAGCVACALATSLPMLVGARIVQGFGGGALLTMAQALIGEAIPPRERGRIFPQTSPNHESVLPGPPLAPRLHGPTHRRRVCRRRFLVRPRRPRPR